MSEGRVVILNGTSSAGKTTIGHAFRESQSDPWLLTGVDLFQSQMSPRWFVHLVDGQPTGAPGWRIAWDGDRLASVTLGPVAQQVMAAMYEAVAALARSGVHVIVDDVLHDAGRRRSMVAALRQRDVYIVAVRCPLDVAEQRERDRGDRRPGGARLFFERAHVEMEYDLEIDSSQVPAPEAAQLIADRLAAGPPGAFARMAVRLT